LKQKRANLEADESIGVDIHDLEHPVKQHVTHSGLSTSKNVIQNMLYEYCIFHLTNNIPER
jgi:hypothetical protein